MTDLKVGDAVVFDGRQGVVREIESNGIRTIVWWYGPEDNTSAIDARALKKVRVLSQREVDSMAKLLDEASNIISEIMETKEAERLSVRYWLPDELRGCAIIMRESYGIESPVDEL